MQNSLRYPTRSSSAIVVACSFVSLSSPTPSSNLRCYVSILVHFPFNFTLIRTWCCFCFSFPTIILVSGCLHIDFEKCTHAVLFGSFNVPSHISNYGRLGVAKPTYLQNSSMPLFSFLVVSSISPSQSPSMPILGFQGPQDNRSFLSFLLQCALAVLFYLPKSVLLLLDFMIRWHIPTKGEDCFIFFNFCFLSFRSMSKIDLCLFFGCLEVSLWKAHRTVWGGWIPSILVVDICC